MTAAERQQRNDALVELVERMAGELVGADSIASTYNRENGLIGNHPDALSSSGCGIILSRLAREGRIEAVDQGYYNLYKATAASAANKLLEGVAWPIASNGDGSLPWVEKDDDSDRFADDIEAAQYVAGLVGSRVMWAPLGSDPQDGSILSPFVLPPLASSSGDSEYWHKHVSIALSTLKSKEA